MDLEKIWQGALAELELFVSKANFTTWLKKATLNSFKEKDVVIGVPNAFTKEWLQNKYHKQIVTAIKNSSDCPVLNISYEIGTKNKITPTTDNTGLTTRINDQQQQRQPQEDQAFASVSKNPEEIKARTSSGIPVNACGAESNLNPRYTFKNYIIGPANELAHAACYAVGTNPGNIYNPLFIYGGVGLGKTHLLHAIGNETQKRFPDKKVRYVTSERFTNEFIDSISRKGSDFKSRYRDVDILIVDDIQFIAGKERTQQEFFHTFNTLYEVNKQIVLSSDRPPKAIPTLEDRLRSRFEGGMIADIGMPELETRAAILTEKCRLKGFKVKEEVITYIATNIQNNIRELEGALNRVVAHCQLKNVQPNKEIAKEVLSSIITNPQRRGILPKQIVESVAQFYDLAIDDLKGASRKKEIVRPRQIAMYLMREEIKASFPSIGHELGGRDHTTAMHANDKITKEVDNNESIKQEIDLIRQRLYIA